MKINRSILLFCILAIVAMASAIFLSLFLRASQPFSLTSTMFIDGGRLPQTVTCDGKGTSPQLTIDRVPPGTVSLVLSMFDPDVTGKGFVHWAVYNIPPQTTLIEAGSLPVGSKIGRSTGGSTGYVPACPPTGLHHYIFTMYALKGSPTFNAPPTLDELKMAMKGKVLGRAQLTALYAR